MWIFLQYRISSFSSCQCLAGVFALFYGEIRQTFMPVRLEKRNENFCPCGSQEIWQATEASELLGLLAQINSKTCCLSSEENQMFEVSSKNRKALHFRDLRFPSLKLEGDSSKFPAGAGRLKWFVWRFWLKFWKNWVSILCRQGSAWRTRRISALHCERQGGRSGALFNHPAKVAGNAVMPWKDEEEDQTRMQQCLAWQKRLWATKSYCFHLIQRSFSFVEVKRTGSCAQLPSIAHELLECWIDVGLRFIRYVHGEKDEKYAKIGQELAGRLGVPMHTGWYLCTHLDHAIPFYIFHFSRSLLRYAARTRLELPGKAL